MSAFFSCLCSFLSSAFRAYKKTGQLFVSVAIGAVFNIVLNLILINIVGVVGASIATAVSFLITWAVRMQKIQRLVKVKIKVIQTVITYVLVIMGCLFISFDIACAYVFYIISCLVIIALNYSDVKGICVSLISMITRIIKKEKPKTEG